MNSSAGLTDVGLKRDHNEDDFRLSDLHGAYVLSDGMGGHDGGEVASRLAVEAAIERLIVSGDEPVARSAAAAVLDAQAAVLAASPGGKRAMGATLVVLVRRGPQCAIAHVGDSRVYAFSRQGQSLALRHKTKDHAEKVTGLLLRAIGHVGGDKPEVAVFPARVGDVYLLCSDGLTNVVSDMEILAMVNRTPDLARVAQSLIRAARAGGGPDNITAVLARFER